MTQAETFTLLKSKIRGFCESTLEPSCNACRGLVWELNSLIDDVKTGGVDLPTVKRAAAASIEHLRTLGLFYTVCSDCNRTVDLCPCKSRFGTRLRCDEAALDELQA